jgi:hypothetical protein
MADEDEDISHLRAPDAGDFDPTEEAQDFRFLDKLTYALALTQQQLHDANSFATEHKIAHTLRCRSAAKRTSKVMRRISNSTPWRPRAGPCMEYSHGSARTHRKAIL